MTDADVERMAREAGYSVSQYGICFPQHGAEDERELLSRFAALVRAQALEDAAKACEDSDTFQYDDPGGGFAELIRAMKDKR